MILTMPPLDWKSWNSWRIFLKPVAFSTLRFLYVVESALKNTEGFHRLWLSHLFKQTCIKYCWWFRNPASVEVGSLSHYLQGSIHPERWLGMGFLNLQLKLSWELPSWLVIRYQPDSCNRPAGSCLFQQLEQFHEEDAFWADICEGVGGCWGNKGDDKETCEKNLKK